MIPGRFFKIDYNFKDFSIFSYTPVVSQNDNKKFPVYVKLSSSFIGFYLFNESSNVNNKLPPNQLLFHIPIKNQYGEEKPSEILKSIYSEIIEDTSIIKLEEFEHKFRGYQLISNDDASNKIYKRKILLDFLFDISHSEVFNKNESIDAIKHFIYNNFFINSILCKHEFLFARREYFKFKTSFASPPVFEKIKVFSLRLKEAEKKWLDMLFKEEANNFSFSKNWFDHIEDEMENVILTTKIKIDANEEKDNFSRAKWQEEYLKDKKINKKQAINDILKERTQIFNFYINRYEFYQPFVWVRKTMFPLGFLGSIILEKHVIRILCILFFLGPFVGVNIPLLLILLGFIGAYFSILAPFPQIFLERINKISNKIDYLFSSKKTADPFLPPLHIKAIAPKMTISILIGWLTFFPFAEELWDINSNPIYYSTCFYILLVVILLVIICFTIYYEVKLIEPSTMIEKSREKVGRLFLIGFSFSIGIGIILLHFSCSHMFDKEKFYLNNFEGKLAYHTIKSNTQQLDNLFHFQEKINKISDENTFNQKINLLNSDFYKLKLDTFFSEQTLLTSLQSDSLQSFQQKKIKLLKVIQNKINEKSITLPILSKSAVKSYAKSMENESIPNIYYSDLCRVFIFPKLLILQALIAFIIGFFVQFIVDSKAYKQPV